VPGAPGTIRRNGPLAPSGRFTTTLQATAS